MLIGLRNQAGKIRGSCSVRGNAISPLVTVAVNCTAVAKFVTVGESWSRNEIAIKVKGKLKWLYRAVDIDGNTIDFLLSAKRNQKAALKFLKKAVRQTRCPREDKYGQVRSQRRWSQGFQS
jgi:transposase-like protein